MFQVYKLGDTLVMEPGELDDVQTAVLDTLKSRYERKIIPEEGLCLCLKDGSL